MGPKTAIHRTLRAVVCAATALAISCTGGVPGPGDSTKKKSDHCEELSKDATVGCRACASLEFCGWTQTGSVHEGTCRYVEPPTQPPIISNPSDCPSPE